MSKSKLQPEKELEARDEQIASQQNMLQMMEQELINARNQVQQSTLFELDARRRLEQLRDLLDASQQRVRELIEQANPA
jgi:hypothetical protein